jgi:hypothetical protein
MTTGALFVLSWSQHHPLPFFVCEFLLCELPALHHHLTTVPLITQVAANVALINSREVLFCFLFAVSHQNIVATAFGTSFNNSSNTQKDEQIE